jgi:CheY-like chemotaxis protein
MARKRILIVDDSATVVMMERMVLWKDYDIVTAGDGLAGLDAAQKNHPDLILLDVVMPRLDGFETLKRLKADPATRAIPVVMVTTKSELPNVTKAYLSGCKHYLTKPIDAPELLATVQRVLAA